MIINYLRKRFADGHLNYLLILVGIVFLLAELTRVSDFGIFLQASEDILEAKNVYQIWYGVGFRYYYSPLFALLISPLTFFPDYVAASLWSVLGFILLIRTIYLLNRYVAPIENPGKLNSLMILCGLTVIYANFHNNQMSAFILWTMIEALEQTRKGRWILGSAILGLGINIKLLPLVILPFLIYRRYFKSGIATVFWVVFFLILPAVWIGWDFNVSLLKSYWNYINPTLKQNVIDIDEPGLLSLSSLITTWFTDFFSLNELGLRRHLVVLPNSTIGMIILMVRLVFIALTLYFLKWPPFVRSRTNIHALWELSYICLATPLLFPHQQNYGFYLILPAIFFILYCFRSRKISSSRWMIWIFVLGVLLINSELILGAYKKVFLNYKVLTYGVLLLLLVLLRLDPVKKEDTI